MVNNIQNTQYSTNNITNTNKNQVVGKEDFLNLLVTQLKYQDPLNPMDSSQFTAQLAQFSALEQMTNVNTNIESLIQEQSKATNKQTISYIGKNITFSGNSITKNDEKIDEIIFDLNQNANKVNIQIFNSDGKEIRKMQEGSMEYGNHIITWDGKDDNGNTVENDEYSFIVNAYDTNDKPIATNLYVEKKVTGITFNEGQVYLNAGNTVITEDKIIQVTEN